MSERETSLPSEGVIDFQKTQNFIHLMKPRAEISTSTFQLLSYAILSQSCDEIEILENSPAVSMLPFLLASSQAERLNEISIYTESGTTPEKARFLYLNSFALSIWSQMGKNSRIMGRLRRPPSRAELSFGMPFPE